MFSGKFLEFYFDFLHLLFYYLSTFHNMYMFTRLLDEFLLDAFYDFRPQNMKVFPGSNKYLLKMIVLIVKTGQ
jgi:hypothetical protein